MFVLRLQEWIHKLEVGAGTRYLKFLLSALAMTALALLYDGHAFKKLATEEAMDVAQVARNVAAGKGYTTDFVRPFSMHLVQRHRADHDPQVRGAHPDLANPPAYPMLLAGWMKVAPFRYVSPRQLDFLSSYRPDLLIAVLNQALFFLAACLLFGLARQLFDARVAWMSDTIRSRPWTDPGLAVVSLVPKWIEHCEPGGVNWTTCSSPVVKSASSRQPSPP